MRNKVSTSAVALGLLWAAAPAAAQTGDLRQIQRELQQVREDYQSKVDDLRRSYEQRLQSMEERLRNAETQATTAASRAQAAEQRVAAPPQAPARAQSRAAASTGGGLGVSNAFNPAISLVLDGGFSYFSRNFSSYRNPGFSLGEEVSSPGRRGFSIGETELSLSANVDQWLFANATLAFSAEDGVEVEEAYFQTTSLPWGFSVKGGRFFSGIGYLNQFHAHSWDFKDQALPYKVFLNQQLGDDGVQVKWLAPTPFFLELGAEALRGDSFPAAGPANKYVGSYSAFVHAGGDIGASHSYRVGASHLRSEANNRLTNDNVDRFTGRSNLTILDAVYKWAPNGNPTERNLKLQGEYFFRNETGLFNGTDYEGTQRGFYVQGVWQFMPRWVLALRHDEVKADNNGSMLVGTTLDPLGETKTLRRDSVALSFFTSEFGRFRLQYNFDQTRPNPDHQMFFQYTLELGAHPAHGF